MKKDNAAFRFKVGELVSGEQGMTQTHEINARASFADVQGNLRASLVFMKLDDAINVAASDIAAQVQCVCSRCLKKYAYSITIPFAERQFFLEEPQYAETGEDIGLVDMKHSEIDLSEMFRQELILHTPSIAFCKEDCKGLCEICGKDLNSGQCSCKKVESGESGSGRPLHHLRDIVR